jgi:hypothetical protein
MSINHPHLSDPSWLTRLPNKLFPRKNYDSSVSVGQSSLPGSNTPWTDNSSERSTDPSWFTNLRNKLFPQKNYDSSATMAQSPMPRPNTPWTDNGSQRSASPAPDLRIYRHQIDLSQFDEVSGRASTLSRPETPRTDNGSQRSASPSPNLWRPETPWTDNGSQRSASPFPNLWRPDTPWTDTGSQRSASPPPNLSRPETPWTDNASPSPSQQGYPWQNNENPLGSAASSWRVGTPFRPLQRLVELNSSSINDVPSVTLNAEHAALNASGPLSWAQRGREWGFGEPYGQAQTPPQRMHAAPAGYFSGVPGKTESATLNAGRNLPQAPLAGEWDTNGLYLRAQTQPPSMRTPSARYESVAQRKAEYAMHAEPADSTAAHPSLQAPQERRPSTPQQPFGERLPTHRATTPTEGVVQPIPLRSAPGDAPPSPPRIAGATTIGSSTNSPSAFNDRPRATSPSKSVAISPTR